MYFTLDKLDFYSIFVMIYDEKLSVGLIISLWLEELWSWMVLIIMGYAVELLLI